MGSNHWPKDILRENTLARFIEAFHTLGYEPCKSISLEADLEKVAIYADENGAPTHAVRQLATGSWTSKLGREDDIEHHTLAGVQGWQYGTVIQILKRPRLASPSTFG